MGRELYTARMARKAPEQPESVHRGIYDVFGIVLCFSAVLLLLALVTFDPGDSSYLTVPANNTPRNMGGAIGAAVSLGMFWSFGVAAYIFPTLLLIFGLGYIFQFLAHLRRSWIWAALLLICCMGLLRTYEDDFALLHKVCAGLKAPSVGGMVGYVFHEYALKYFGKVGATIVLGAVYVISLLYLTNFRLGAFCRNWWNAKFHPELAPEEEIGGTEDELEKRARELEKERRRLQEQLDKKRSAEPAAAGDKGEKSGLGADGLPVPEPTVRDLSVPQAKAPRGKKDPVQIGEVISAREIAAASTEDILGKKAPAKSVESKPADAPEPAAEAEDAVKGATDPEDAPLPPPLPVAAPKARLAPKKKPISVASTPQIGNYALPPLDFLQYPDLTVKPTESKEELMANARLMQQTLAQFDIDVALGDITKGPTITRYELHPAPGVKLEKISGLTNNIAAALKAERINILAPVPGKSSVGVEVPNAIKTKVIMRDLFESEEWKNTRARIPLALGKDVYGQPIIADLAEMPHCLIAGSTGSGKSVCINSIIASLLYKFGPDKLRFVMIDPKVVELQQYNALPHLVVPVVNDPKKVILALRWVVNEMEKRYQIFARVGVRNIKSFNERPKSKPLPKPEPELPLEMKKDQIEPAGDGFAVELDKEIAVPRDEDIVIPDYLSYIVVIIDELADLMLVAPADVEMAIARITQMARAAGIHCIVATQRPSVDVITGVIKANIPARIAFQVAAKVDSRTILDAMGADKLLGKGDMLYLPPGSAKLIRAQGVLVTDSEIQAIVDFIATQAKPSYELEIHQQLQKTPSSSGMDGDGGGCDEDEDLIQQCIEVIRSEQKASVSLMQRRLRLGYTRAARIMDELENRGIVGPSKGAEPRDILIDLDGGGADGAGVETGTGGGGA